MAIETMPAASGQGPSSARITEVDIQRPARALAWLRASDYVLVVMCGMGALRLIPDVFRTAATSQWTDFAFSAPLAAILTYAAYVGWRHVGVIDPQVWRAHLRVFPLLAAVAVFLVLVSVTTSLSGARGPLEDASLVMMLLTGLQYLAIAIIGFWFARQLRSLRIPPMNTRVTDVLASLGSRAGLSGLTVTHVPRAAARRGIALGAAGIVLLLVGLFTPIPEDPRQASQTFKIIQLLNMGGFVLVLRARRRFQVSADALLAVDKRAPVLFLRSFGDDERVRYSSAERAVLDFSLETRLANHFHRFGPFIAIGSPKDTAPQLGAARALLAEDQWQSQVLDWMHTASVIIMYCGTTQWVNWELRQIIERGRATSLILMFPEIKGWRPARRREDIQKRVVQIREVFRDTPWSEELAAFSDYAGLRAMLFRPDGSMVMIRSRTRRRDAYHLAALVAHQMLLEPDGSPAAAPVPIEPVRWGRRLAVAGVSAAVFATLYVLGSPGASNSNRLMFKQGELLFTPSVSEADAVRVGEELERQEYFSDDERRTVRIDRQNGVVRLTFVVNAARVGDTLVAFQFGLIGGAIARDALGSQPVELVLADARLQPIKTVPVTTELDYGKSVLFYSQPVSTATARAAGDALQRLEYFENEREVSVHLAHEDGIHQLRFVVDSSRASDREIIEAFREIGRVVGASALGGQPVVVRLCDNELKTLRAERVAGTGQSVRR